MSLRALLLLLVTAVALPLIVLAGVAVLHAHEQARGRAEAEALGQARTLAAVVDREFQRVLTGLQALADSTALARGDLTALETEMRAMSAQLSMPIGLAAADGRQLLGTDWPPGQGRQAATAPPDLATSFATGRALISNLATSPDTGRKAVAMVMPVPSPAPDGSPRGQASHAFVATLPEGRLAATLRERAPPGVEAPVASLLDRAGVIVARSLAEGEQLGKAIQPGFAALLAQQAEGVLHNATTREGTPASFAFATAPRSGFTVTLSLPDAEFTAPLWDALRRVGLLSAGILAAGVAVAAVLASRIAAALHRLSVAAPPERPILREVDALARAMAERDRAAAGLAESERRFRALAEAGALVVWRSDAQGAILEGEGWEALTGQPDSELRGDGWLAMLHPLDLDGTIAAWGEARRNGTPVDLEYRVRTAAGEWHWVRARAVPLVADGVTSEWVGVVEDVHERRQATLALADRQERLRLAVAAARLTTWDYDPLADRGARIASAGEAIEAPATSGFTLAEWTGAIHPEDRPGTLARIQAVLDGEAQEFSAEFRVRRRPPAEGWAWIESHGAAAERDPVTNKVRRIAGVSQDVSERREAEQRRTLLMREVDHRAKNVLAVVQSVLRLSRRDQPEAFIATVEARVAALARAHTLLAEEGWAGADLRVLAERELAVCPPGSVALNGPPLAMAAAAVQPLAMVLHELATNAAKHGAASCLDGKVTLDWALDNGSVRLDWVERGGPPVSPAPARRGFGSRMMEAILRGQLGGTLSLHWNPAGLECRITLPADRVLSPEALGPLRQPARSHRPEASAEPA